MKKHYWILMASIMTCSSLLVAPAEGMGNEGDSGDDTAGLVSFGAAASAPNADTSGAESGSMPMPGNMPAASPAAGNGMPGGNMGGASVLPGAVASLDQLKSSILNMRENDPNGTLSPEQVQMVHGILQTAQQEMQGSGPSPDAQAADTLLNEIQDMVNGEQACANNAQSLECGEYKEYLSNEKAMSGGFRGTMQGGQGQNAVPANQRQYPSCGTFHRKNCVNKNGQIIGLNGKVIGTVSPAQQQHPACGLTHKTNCINKAGQLVTPPVKTPPTCGLLHHTNCMKNGQLVTSSSTTKTPAVKTPPSCGLLHHTNCMKNGQLVTSSSSTTHTTTPTTPTSSSTGTHWWNKKPATTPAVKKPTTTSTSSSSSSSGTHWWNKKKTTATPVAQHTTPTVAHTTPSTSHSMFGNLFHKSTPATTSTPATS